MAIAEAAANGFYAVQLLNVAPGPEIAYGGELVISGEVFSPDGRPPVVLVGIVRADGNSVYGVATDMDGATPRRVAADRYAFSLTLPQLSLLPGKYAVRAHAMDPEGLRLFDHVERPLLVTGEAREYGVVRLPHRWG
jgi:lipopolysaccharide transport system ATP-binding protein